MIKNFDEVKKQLSALSSIINAFKSEAVQLRIVELIFQAAPLDDSSSNSHEEVGPTPKPQPSKRRKGKSKKEPRIPGKKVSRPGGHGPVTVINELIADGFFKEKRTLKAIIDHCAVKKARTFKQSELSGPLAKLVKARKLDRDKKEKGRYEYFAK